jgi:hypothetical protein
MVLILQQNSRSFLSVLSVSCSSEIEISLPSSCLAISHKQDRLIAYNSEVRLEFSSRIGKIGDFS